eukprot:GILJ01006128.1.p1 GENE.GILJ01006128.1~~GILJ01006128.1.p1  ORF type:complete len:289 (-),score=22.60 GILJ01006128.1:40-906(-)
MPSSSCSSVSSVHSVFPGLVFHHARPLSSMNNISTVEESLVRKGSKPAVATCWQRIHELWLAENYREIIFVVRKFIEQAVRRMLVSRGYKEWGLECSSSFASVVEAAALVEILEWPQLFQLLQINKMLYWTIPATNSQVVTRHGSLQNQCVPVHARCKMPSEVNLYDAQQSIRILIDLLSFDIRERGTDDDLYQPFLRDVQRSALLSSSFSRPCRDTVSPAVSADLSHLIRRDADRLRVSRSVSLGHLSLLRQRREQDLKREPTSVTRSVARIPPNGLLAFRISDVCM